MAKISVCDVCRKDGKLVPAIYKIGRKSAVQKIILDVCEEHKDTFEGLDAKQALDVAIKIIGGAK